MGHLTGPQPQFAGTSGILIRPNNRPRLLKTQIPPGPVVYPLPWESTFIPSGTPSLAGSIACAKTSPSSSEPSCSISYTLRSPWLPDATHSLLPVGVLSPGEQESFM